MTDKEMLMEIISNSPDPISDDLRAELLGPRIMDQEPRNMYNQGQLVQNTVDGSRPGYKRGNITTHPVTPLSKDEAKIYEMVQEKKLPHQKGASGSTKLAQTYNKPWEELLSNQRRSFRQQIYPHYKDLLAKTKGMVSRSQLSEILTEKLDRNISLGQIHGYGTDRKGKRQKTAFGKKLDEVLDVKRITQKNPMYKIPTDADIKKLKPLLNITPANSLKNSTADNIVKLNKKYSGVYKSGKLPSLETVLKNFPNMTSTQASNATIQLSQIYSGNKFKLFSNLDPKIKRALENIKVDKKLGNKVFKLIGDSQFNDYRRSMYRISLGMIDEKLGNKKGTFESLKTQARQILKDNKIPIYSPEKKNAAGKIIQKATQGFNINEIAGVSGSAKSKAAEFSQFIDVMEGNLNQKTMANFQSKLSSARQLIENNPSMLSSESKKINKLARNLENEYSIELPRLRDPDATKYFSPKRLKELNTQGLDIVKAAERAGYTVQMPKGAITINEFTKQNPQTKNILSKIAALGGKGCNRKVAFAGGRMNFDVGGSAACISKGLERLKNPTNLSPGENANLRALKEMSTGPKGVKILGNAARVLGKLGVVSEGAIGGLLALNDYAGGSNKEEIISNFTYGLAGKSQEKQLTEQDPQYGLDRKILTDYAGLNSMGQRKDSVGRMSVKPGIEKQLIETIKKRQQPFMSGPRNEEFDMDRFYKQQEKTNQADIDYQKAKDQRVLERRVDPFAQEAITEETDFMAAEGGLAGLMKKYYD
jgi:hypothetical protein